MNKKELGKIGEDFAENYFKNKGFLISARNFRTPFGEIDLIAEKKNIIIFVEVKTRRTMDFGAPIEAVDNKKQEKIRFIANYYLSKFGKKNLLVRFDVFSIILDENNKIMKWEHIENAF
ncbi:MAG: YraN family protein [Dictyoglomus sp. NZ13-RE01]|nr:MAG: YraN family protein [Dictyoglomus sp. NZ13-RE01]